MARSLEGMMPDQILVPIVDSRCPESAMAKSNSRANSRDARSIWSCQPPHGRLPMSKERASESQGLEGATT